MSTRVEDRIIQVLPASETFNVHESVFPFNARVAMGNFQ